MDRFHILIKRFRTFLTSLAGIFFRDYFYNFFGDIYSFLFQFNKKYSNYLLRFLTLFFLFFLKKSISLLSHISRTFFKLIWTFETYSFPINIYIHREVVAQWASVQVLGSGEQVQTPLQSACRCVPETLHPKLLLRGLSTVLSM